MPNPSLETVPDQLALNPKSTSKPTPLDCSAREVSTVSLFPGSTSTGISGGQFNTAQGVTIIINERSSPHHATTSSTNGSEPLRVARERSELVRTTGENSSVTAEDTTIEEQSANAIYERQLLQKKHGFPLWIPHPNTELPVSYQQTGVSIGDVGLITPDGAFDYLFNICLSSDHPSNPEVLPSDFSPLSISSADIRKFRDHSRGSHLASISVKKQRGLTFRGSKSEGAILAMPEGAYHEDLRNRKAFRDYASHNAASWYQFVNGTRGCELANGELHLVTGCDKTTSWGIASYSNNIPSGPAQDGPILTFLTVNGDDSHPLRTAYSWEHDGTAEAKTWPEPDLDGGGDAPGTSWTTQLRNQSTFIRSFTIALSDAIWNNLAFNLGSELETDALELKSPPSSSNSLQSTPSGHRNNGSVILTDWQSRSHTIHPSTLILKMLMQKHPQAKVAIVHDSDWCSVLEEDAGQLPDGSEFFNRIQRKFDVIIDENGTLYLAEKEISLRDQEISELSSLGLTEAEEESLLPVGQAALRGTTLSSNPHACSEEAGPVVPPKERPDAIILCDEMGSCLASQEVTPSSLPHLSKPRSLTQSAPVVLLRRLFTSLRSRPKVSAPLNKSSTRGAQEDSCRTPIFPLCPADLGSINTLSQRHVPSLPSQPTSSISLQTLLSLSGVPGLHAGVTTLTATYDNLQNVKLYQQQCKDMGERCVILMVAIQEGSEGLEGSRALEVADEIEVVIGRIDRKVKEWASWSLLKSFLQQGEMKDGIDRLHRDIDAAMMKFSVRKNMELARGHMKSQAIRERDKEELREALQTIVKSTDDVRSLLNMQSSRPLEEIMESLQTELMDPSLQPRQQQSFREGLWLLHEKTDKLPPLTDLTGQVTVNPVQVVAKGAPNDVYMGQWLDKEQVAVRLPRALANDPEAQRRFQREVTIWRALRHPNVIPLYGIAYLRGHLYSVSPWMDHGTAISYVKKNPQVDRLKLLTEVANGLQYLHSKGVVHGDLRGAKILIAKDGSARLSDFGLSKILEDCRKGITFSPAINPRWLAPELLQQTAPASTHSDVWSFGMVCLEILSGHQPFKNISRDIAVMRDLDNGKIPERPGQVVGLSDDVWALMRKCWSKKPETRPSMPLVKEKLLEIRRMPNSSVGSEPIRQKRRSIFSLPSSPSTGDSASSSGSSRSIRQLKMPFVSGNGTPEVDELSPISISTSKGYNVLSLPAREAARKEERPPIFDVEFTGVDVPVAPTSPQSVAHVERAGLARLEVPHHSAPPPSRYGSRFLGQSTFSSDSFSSLIRSVISTDSGIQMCDPVRQAVIDSRSIVRSSTTGSVVSGTLEGFVGRLINHFNLRKDLEFRDTLLTACADFTTPEDLFEILGRRFHEAELGEVDHPEDRVAIQYNIFMVIMYWLSSRHLPIDQQLLRQMRNFCEVAIRMKTSSTMVDKAGDLLRMIDERSKKDLLTSASLSPERKLLQGSDLTPRDVAIALTLLEGDKYKAIVPSDYIVHLRRRSTLNSVEVACSVNNKIVLWVKQSVLHYDTAESRAQVLMFFLNTAHECRKLRNYGSLIAIGTALHSAPIERLNLTKAGLSPPMRRKLEELEDIFNPSSNHRGYHEVLNQVVDPKKRDYCIPWLAVHLKDLHSVLKQNPIVVEDQGRPLINFQRYVKFMDRIKEILYYKPPDMEQYRQQGQLAYLENQLKDVKLAVTTDDELMERSIALEMSEALDLKYRRRKLRSLGFRTS